MLFASQPSLDRARNRSPCGASRRRVIAGFQQPLGATRFQPCPLVTPRTESCRSAVEPTPRPFAVRRSRRNVRPAHAANTGRDERRLVLTNEGAGPPMEDDIERGGRNTPAPAPGKVTTAESPSAGAADDSRRTEPRQYLVLRHPGRDARDARIENDPWRRTCVCVQQRKVLLLSRARLPQCQWPQSNGEYSRDPPRT